ncbi:PH domain-containing protein [Homoserinibacter sp. YIM 151385]|uniref:PH domain-containing protein n=1 Tax=Homoserinibacter sp. YIM 151385 TaxID=2985506 RepID=UPI0022F00482|nr:PH domain-containing protein [Homoserinibacter sp. YIM 151385]WBU37555.1 PH domain-containing protein [Homoserinibacter sp. YIM 151385]
MTDEPQTQSVTETAAGARLEPDPGAWIRVSPKYLVVDLVTTIVWGAIVTAASAIPWILSGVVGLAAIPAGLGLIFLLVAVFTPRRVRAIGYRLREDDLLFRTGILFQRFVAVPYGRMQLVDINRGPLARAVGLSELKLVTAAAATNITIPGLPEADAEGLRDRLVDLAETRRAGL